MIHDGDADGCRDEEADHNDTDDDGFPSSRDVGTSATFSLQQS